MKHAAKRLCAEAERLGYEHTAVNSSGHLVYTHPSGHEVRINPSAPEHQAREVTKAMRKTAGCYEVTPGRSGQRAKDRQHRRHELDAARRAAERRTLQAQRDAYLARIARAPHLNDDPAALRRVEARLSELDRLDALMRTAPSTEHRVRHTAGVREPA